MDKETLSNYGWIVVLILVLSVLIALATPFGQYVKLGIESTTQGLFDVEQNALSATGIDIADQSFPCEHKNQETVAAKESTSTEQGWDEYTKCSDCGKILTADGNIPLLPLLRTEPKDHGAVEWETLISASEDGSYESKYIVGDTVTLTMKDSSTAQFRIVGIDHDDLADGTGKAHLTLISEKTLVNHKMNSSTTNAGGWESSAMRTYLNGDYMNTVIPDAVAGSIKSVSKKSFDYNGGSRISQTTSDKLWIPSFTEVGFNASQSSTVFNTEGGSAYAYFTDSASRKKKGTSTSWWLRSADSSYSLCFYIVLSDSDYYYYSASNSYGVALGFCI